VFGLGAAEGEVKGRLINRETFGDAEWKKWREPPRNISRSWFWKICLAGGSCGSWEVASPRLSGTSDFGRARSPGTRRRETALLSRHLAAVRAFPVPSTDSEL
jgi:hypothetical protein